MVETGKVCLSGGYMDVTDTVAATTSASEVI